MTNDDTPNEQLTNALAFSRSTPQNLSPMTFKGANKINIHAIKTSGMVLQFVLPFFELLSCAMLSMFMLTVVYDNM